MQGPRRSECTRGWRSPTWQLGLVAALLFTVCLGSNRTLTDHEALLAGSAKEMVLSGDWLLLRIGDQLWLEKPPLPQYLAAITAVTCGVFNEWTMRLPFAVAGVLVVLIVARLMTRLFGPQVGWLAGFVQATSVYQVAYARLAESDVVLQVFVLGAIAVFVDLETQHDQLSGRQQTLRRFAFWGLLGCTNLAKGLVFGAALVILTCAGWLILRRGWSAWRRWWSPLGMLSAVAIAVAWPLAVIWKDPTALELWREHTLGRAAGSLGYTQPFWYYATTWPTQLLPWTPFFLIALPRSFQRARQESSGPDRFIWWWMLSQPALLSLSSGKHHHYLIYALPACSALSAQGLLLTAEWLRDERRSWRFWRISGWGLSAGALVAAIAVAIVRPEFRWDAVFLGGLFALGNGCLAFAIGRRNVQLAGLTLGTAFVAGHIYAQAAILPRRDPSAADKQFLAEVERLVPSDAPLVASGCQEIARHIFYIQRPVIGIWDPREIAEQLPETSAYYVITRGYAAPDLQADGQVQQVAQSTYTRRERTPEDRYTLFRIEPTRMVERVANRE